ncbi:YbaB/EbfC family DNA-binding protein [Pseudonocardiaceae bacterium YIM PH 21723]|nr:YbaB/EbfC family DNA-binding protein [Pseudonocardiaceae bacterium YIM PH 21723]
MKERLRDIKADPARALFSDYRGESQDGSVTAWVDLLGRPQRIEFRPGTAQEGRESYLAEQVMQAFASAAKASNFINFDRADLAKSLDSAPALKQQLSSEQPAPPPSAGRRPVQDDDDYFESGGYLR